MKYQLQLVTTDFALQLKTELFADSLEQLLYLAKKMVTAIPASIGNKYRVFEDGRMIKEDVIRGA